VSHADTLGATEMFTGANHGSAASLRVRAKCGFVEVAKLDSCTRFRRPIDRMGWARTTCATSRMARLSRILTKKDRKNGVVSDVETRWGY
jgi:hypothetical protein